MFALEVKMYKKVLRSAYKRLVLPFIPHERIHIKLISASARIPLYGGSIDHPVITNVTPNLAFCFIRTYICCTIVRLRTEVTCWI